MNGVTNRVRKKQSGAIIAADVRRFSYLINTDQVFGTHRAGFPMPVPTEAGPMPTHEGLGPDDGDGLEDRWKPSIQLNQEQTIAVRELDATAHPGAAAQSVDDGAPSRLFDLKREETNRAKKKQSSAIIAVDVRRFGHVINKDEVFGTHRCRD